LWSCKPARLLAKKPSSTFTCKFREQPLVVEHVETRRDSDFPWVLFTAGTAARDLTAEQIREPRFVRDDQIVRVELGFRPAGWEASGRLYL
jgi:hypothetical protein